ncbi:MAG: hypothetical protein ACXW13_09705, partial [Burkholderiaceae bacterium]
MVTGHVRRVAEIRRVSALIATRVQVPSFARHARRLPWGRTGHFTASHIRFAAEGRVVYHRD